MNLLRRLPILSSALILFPISAAAQNVDTAKIESALGRPGTVMGDVYRVAFPRSDLHVTVHGLAIKPGLALGSWAAFMGTDDHAMVMGDLVLLDEELTPVMQKLTSSGYEVTAVHNHLINETPHIIYMHYMAHGPATQLATSLHAALALSKTPLEKPAPAATEATSPSWVASVEASVGRKGTFRGGVLSYGIPRAQAIASDGMTIPPSAGMGTAVNFQAADGNNVATTGDFVLIAEEVNPVIAELEKHNIAVTALHSHMLTEQPRLFFMHFWAVGSPDSVGAGIATALKHVAVK